MFHINAVFRFLISWNRLKIRVKYALIHHIFLIRVIWPWMSRFRLFPSPLFSSLLFSFQPFCWLVDYDSVGSVLRALVFTWVFTWWVPAPVGSVLAFGTFLYLVMQLSVASSTTCLLVLLGVYFFLFFRVFFHPMLLTYGSVPSAQVSWRVPGRLLFVVGIAGFLCDVPLSLMTPSLL